MSGFVIKETPYESKYPKPEAGTHMARCVKVIDLGTYDDPRWDDGPKREVLLGFEFPDMDAGPEGPVLLFKRYNFSLKESATLRKDLKSWRGEDYTPEQLAAGVDVSEVVGMPCQVSVEAWKSQTGDKSGVKISGLAKPMKGIECPKQISTSLVWLIEEWDQEAFDSFAPFLKDRIMASDEAKARTASSPQDSTDIPF